MTSCVPVQCEDPGDVPFARRLTPRRTNAYFYGDTIIYACFEGRSFVEIDQFGNE